MNDQNLLIGMLLNGAASLGDVLAHGLSPTDFEDERCQTVFAAMLDADRRGEPIDLPSLGARLGNLARWLVEVSEHAPIASDSGFYVREILAMSWARRSAAELASLATALVNREPHTDADHLREEAGRILERLAAGPEFGRGGATTAAAACDELFNEVERNIVASQNGIQPGLSTGFRGMDRVIHRLRPGWLYVIGARPGVGKTAMGCQIALHNALEGANSCYFTREMPAPDLAGRMIQAHGSIDGDRMLEGTLDDEALHRFIHSAHKIGTSALHIDDAYRGRLEALEMTCQRLKRQGKLGLVVVDYIQQLRLTRRDARMTRSDELGEIAIRLKDLAMTLNVPVIALAQLNREGAKVGEPKAHHLKDAGGIEQEADVIILLHCDKDLDPDTTWAIVDKNRRGQECRIRYRNDMQHSRFVEDTRG